MSTLNVKLGKTKYQLKLSTPRALYNLDTALGASAIKYILKAAKDDQSEALNRQFVTTAVWAGLHEDNLTLDQVIDMMPTDQGQLAEVAAIVMQALTETVPEEALSKDEGEKKEVNLNDYEAIWKNREKAAYFYGLKPSEFWDGDIRSIYRFIAAKQSQEAIDRSQWDCRNNLIRWVGYVQIALNHDNKKGVLHEPEYYFRLPHDKEADSQPMIPTKEMMDRVRANAHKHNKPEKKKDAKRR